jgi:hypothetical protein
VSFAWLARQNAPLANAGVVNESGSVLKARQLHLCWVWRGERDQLGLRRVSRDVGLEPVVDEHAYAADGGIDCALRRTIGSAERRIRG